MHPSAVYFMVMCDINLRALCLNETLLNVLVIKGGILLKVNGYILY